MDKHIVHVVGIRPVLISAINNNQHVIGYFVLNTVGGQKK